MSNRKKSGAPQGDDRGDVQSDWDDEVSENQAGNDNEAADADERDAGSDSDGVSAPQAASEVDALNARIDELEQELSGLKDQYLRKQADFENFRKRMLREKEDAIAYANKQLLLDMVTVIDDFERAIQSAEESRDFDSFHDGIVLIEKQLVSMLERKWGLKRFDSTGEPFDPQRHEALMTEEVSGPDDPVVLEDFQKGYLLHERVLRSAKVKVSMPAAK